MRKLTDALLAAALAAALVLGWQWAMEQPTDKKALWTTTKVVYVESHLAANWAPALRNTRRFVDQYTGTGIAIHPCDSTHRCIKVYNRNVPGKWTGREYRSGPDTIIEVERTIPSSYRTSVLDHEFGHAFGLRDNPHCVSRMFPYVTCHGHATPRTYTKAEQRILGRN